MADPASSPGAGPMDGGQAVVARALELLQGEILRGMMLMGLCRVSDITTDCLSLRSR